MDLFLLAILYISSVFTLIVLIYCKKTRNFKTTTLLFINQLTHKRTHQDDIKFVKRIVSSKSIYNASHIYDSTFTYALIK